jgi:hypothetical protein
MLRTSLGKIRNVVRRPKLTLTPHPSHQNLWQDKQCTLTPFLFPCQNPCQDKQCTLTPFLFPCQNPCQDKQCTLTPFLFPCQNPCQDKQCTLTPFPFSLSKPSTTQGFWQCTLTLPHPLLTRKKKMSPLGCMFSRLTDYMKTIVITMSSFSAWANTSI